MDRIDELSDAALLKEVGLRIANLRISARMKQEELAAKAGLSRYALSRLENGAGGIRIDSFLSVLRCLHVLSRLSVLLPDNTLTPIQAAELERRVGKTPKRVRSIQSESVGVWVDVMPVG